MRPRSVQTSAPSGAKRSRTSYGAESSTHPVKEKGELSARAAAESNQRSRGRDAAEKAPTPKKIREQAYSLWDREGRPEGRDEEFWFRAEAELRGH